MAVDEEKEEEEEEEELCAFVVEADVLHRRGELGGVAVVEIGPGFRSPWEDCRCGSASSGCCARPRVPPKVPAEKTHSNIQLKSLRILLLLLLMVLFN